MKLMMTDHGFAATLEHGRLEISGDENFGFRPFQLFTTAVAACTGGVLRIILEKMRLSFNDIQITVEVTRSQTGTSKIERLHLFFEVESDQISNSQFSKALSMTKKSCSMVQSLNENIVLTESFEIRSK